MDVQRVRPFFILRLVCYWLIAIIFRPNSVCTRCLWVYLWRSICSCVYLCSFLLCPIPKVSYRWQLCAVWYTLPKV